MKTLSMLIVTSSALAAIVFTSCQTWKSAPEANLNHIYEGAAQRESIHRNAVIVIPGILGSRLIEPSTQQIVWGAFTREAANPRNPESARLFSLPMAEDRPLRELNDTVVPNGALDRLQVSLFSGFSIQPKAYLQIMKVLGVGGFRDEGLSQFYNLNYGDEHYTCFQFDYDWRRSSAENAALLGQFVREKKAYIEGQNLEKHGTRGTVKFNIVGHSMGALVARYYLRYGEQGMPSSGQPSLTWAGARDIEKVIMIAPPNAGSILALHQSINGFDLGPFTFQYDSALVGTMPSTYELLPRARHRVLKDTLQDKENENLDPLDPQVWVRYQWGLLDPKQSKNLAILLPDVPTAKERTRIAKDHITKCLRNARRFQKAIDIPAQPPAHLKICLFAGDAVDTPVQAEAWPGRIKMVDFDSGDDSVARYSALMDERFASRSSQASFDSPIPWDQVTFLFDSHLGITQSHTFADNVLFELLEK